MKLTFRWYGESDPIPLSYIRQIPCMTGVVTAVYGVSPGEVWPREDIARLKKKCRDAGLTMEVIESVPVHEDIKRGLPTRDRYIDVYIENIRRLADAGVKCICYNFMPVFDWLRTSLARPNEDGSDSLSYSHDAILRLDPHQLHLPGWDESYTPDALRALLDGYAGMTHETLRQNMVYFLERIMPVCEKTGVDMAVHPDDPPWDVFGLPRVVSSEADLDALFTAVPSMRNGLTLCTGSLGAGRGNDLVRMAAKYAAAGRVHFAHLRNIRHENARDFSEAAHPSACGSLDLYAIVRALVENGFTGYVRPDHGRNVWGEGGKPGYGLYDRAMGACYLTGLFEAVEKNQEERK